MDNHDQTDEQLQKAQLATDTNNLIEQSSSNNSWGQFALGVAAFAGTTKLYQYMTQQPTYNNLDEFYAYYLNDGRTIDSLTLVGDYLKEQILLFD